MGSMNTGRWLAGGLAAGVLIWVLEGLGSVIYMEQAEAELAAHSLGFDFTGGMIGLTILLSLLLGLVIVFFYAAARPRLGPGPKSAAVVAFVLWAGMYVGTLVGYGMIGLYSTGLLAKWALIGLVEMVLAAMVGGAIYKEE